MKEMICKNYSINNNNTYMKMSPVWSSLGYCKGIWIGILVLDISMEFLPCSRATCLMNDAVLLSSTKQCCCFVDAFCFQVTQSVTFSCLRIGLKIQTLDTMVKFNWGQKNNKNRSKTDDRFCSLLISFASPILQNVKT